MFKILGLSLLLPLGQPLDLHHMQHSVGTAGNKPPPSMSRRFYLGIGTAVSAMTLNLGAVSPALALKGAAELDAEFYFKRLVDGNKPKDPKPFVPDPATVVDAAFMDRLSALFIEILSKTSGKPQSTLQNRLTVLLSQYEPSFQAKGAFPMEDVSNSRTVNFRVYCWWKLVTESFAADYTARKQFSDALGNAILADACAQDKALGDALGSYIPAQKAASAEKVLGTVDRLLKYLQNAGFLQKFAVEADLADVQEDWDNGYSVDVKVSLSRTVAMGASLQLASEARPMLEQQSPTSGGFTTIDRFRPEIAGLVAGAVFRRFGVSFTTDEFFLDETYREDPNDIRPSLLLQQWSLEPPVPPSSRA